MCIYRNRLIPFTICVMWGGGAGAYNAPPLDYGSGKSSMDERVKERKDAKINF